MKSSQSWIKTNTRSWWILSIGRIRRRSSRCIRCPICVISRRCGRKSKKVGRMEDSTVPRSIRNTIECTPREPSIVMNHAAVLPAAAAPPLLLLVELRRNCRLKKCWRLSAAVIRYHSSLRYVTWTSKKVQKVLDIDKQSWYTLWLLRRTKATRISKKKFKKIKNCLTWTKSSDKIMNCCCEWQATRFRKKLENKMKKVLDKQNCLW